ncbi:YcaO-related McrA-glycine thioamidation protein [Methanoregula sp.]|jgi:ribosomal protein S12 methylthiotransferase accessory factor|uniref:YcaO-related McrA-glycine thioamidation protein n=1 Tax=Methanoregula sp. TaxID=2052170 RepID=UPI0025CF95B0|nr:YcaO-related McrA-glycine thioamidation protein [Methanoregula sp.]
MLISSCKKTYNNETQRAVPLEETLARIEPKVPAAGITRVADITDLDRIGIPVFSCIRPTADDGAITVYNGKGATVEESRISAIMEGIERYSSEIHDRKVQLDSFEMLDGREPAVNPKDLILPADTETGHVLPWVEGWDIANDEPVLVPAQAVFHPLPRNFRQIFRTSTNGLASGNTTEEAIFHALSEVIERDAWSLVEACRDTGPAVIGIDDPMLVDMQKKFADAQVEVTLRDITSDVGIPTMAAVADDVLLKDPALLTIGIGTHTCARIAAMRALTEVAQSRLTQIHGAREDTTTAGLRKKMGYDRAKRINGYWFKDNGTVDYGTLRSFDSDDFAKDIRFSIDALKKQGLDRVIVVDLTREEIGIPVVRVIVPGLEVYAMDPERRGDRVKHAKNHRLSRAKP